MPEVEAPAVGALEPLFGPARVPAGASATSGRQGAPKSSAAAALRRSRSCVGSAGRWMTGERRPTPARRARAKHCWTTGSPRATSSWDRTVGMAVRVLLLPAGGDRDPCLPLRGAQRSVPVWLSRRSSAAETASERRWASPRRRRMGPLRVQGRNRCGQDEDHELGDRLELLPRALRGTRT